MINSNYNIAIINWLKFNLYAQQYDWGRFLTDTLAYKVILCICLNIVNISMTWKCYTCLLHCDLLRNKFVHYKKQNAVML